MPTKKIGILGGGQLGRLFLQAAYDYPFDYAVLDTQGAPCQAICQHFVEGDFNDYDQVVAFGQQMEVIGIEIEHVNTEALAVLEKQGKTVIPKAHVLKVIKDKGLQKQHYKENQIKTPDYYLIEDKAAVDLDRLGFPFVQKLRTGGYDGKGVQIIRDAQAMSQLWDAPSVIEAYTPIDKEIAVLVAKGQLGETAVYPVVEMAFDTTLNLVDYLISPAEISQQQQAKAIELALQVADSFTGAGLFAVELFIDTAGQLWVNETAPRVHNSGHHTIEAAYCSQFEQMLRILAGLPLGNTQLREAGAMINLVGAAGHQGQATIAGLEQLAQLDRVYLHWYGKSVTSPGRKMGHITVLGDKSTIKTTLAQVKTHVKVVSQNKI